MCPSTAYYILLLLLEALHFFSLLTNITKNGEERCYVYYVPHEDVI